MIRNGKCHSVYGQRYALLTTIPTDIKGSNNTRSTHTLIAPVDNVILTSEPQAFRAPLNRDVYAIKVVIAHMHRVNNNSNTHLSTYREHQTLWPLRGPPPL